MTSKSFILLDVLIIKERNFSKCPPENWEMIGSSQYMQCLSLTSLIKEVEVINTVRKWFKETGKIQSGATEIMP